VSSVWVDGSRIGTARWCRASTMNPKKLGKLDNHDQEPWKLPLPEFIAKLYSKRFGKGRPDAVRSIEETAAATQAKKQAKKTAANGARQIVDQRDDQTQ
jgi:hypothetical protein